MLFVNYSFNWCAFYKNFLVPEYLNQNSATCDWNLETVFTDKKFEVRDFKTFYGNNFCEIV